MRVHQYSVALDEGGKSILVKDFARNYAGLDRLNNPGKVAKLMRDMFQLHLRAEEYLYLICMNIKGRPIGFFETFHGTCDTAIANPREILVRALLCGAASILIVHNHPSGSPEPSQSDDVVTERVQNAANLVGITFFDHIIIGGNAYYSYQQEEKLSTKNPEK